MGNFFTTKSKKSVYIDKSKSSKKINYKKYELNTKPISVRFITYGGEVLPYKPKYSYIYKGVPGGFY